MRQPGREHEQGAVAHGHHNLVSVIRRQFGDRRTNNGSLRARIVKTDRVCAFLSLHIVNTAQKIIRMAMHFVCRTGVQHVHPATSDAKRGISYLDKRKHVAHGCFDTGDQLREFGFPL
jgi:hypothetical protein